MGDKGTCVLVLAGSRVHAAVAAARARADHGSTSAGPCGRRAATRTVRGGLMSGSERERGAGAPGPTEGLGREFERDRRRQQQYRQEELDEMGDSGEVTEGLSRQFGIDQSKHARDIA